MLESCSCRSSSKGVKHKLGGSEPRGSWFVLSPAYRERGRWQVLRSGLPHGPGGKRPVEMGAAEEDERVEVVGGDDLDAALERSGVVLVLEPPLRVLREE